MSYLNERIIVNNKIGYGVSILVLMDVVLKLLVGYDREGNAHVFQSLF